MHQLLDPENTGKFNLCEHMIQFLSDFLNFFLLLMDLAKLSSILFISQINSINKHTNIYFILFCPIH